MATDIPDTKQNIYKSVRDGARDAGVFKEVTIDDRGVSCAALTPAAPAFYRLSEENGALWVSLETEDRWLSGSIEADLVNTGDKLDDLIEEEVVDLGDVGAKVNFEHFRSEEKIYVFRSRLTTPIEDPRAAANALIWLRGYEIVFRDLGDMDDSGED